MRAIYRFSTVSLCAMVIAIASGCAKAPGETDNKAAANANSSQPATVPAGTGQPAAEQPANRAARVTEPAQTGTGSIEVTSNPAGAAVLLISLEDDQAGSPQPRGASPTTITNVKPGKYAVHLEKPGYKYFQKSIAVAENKTTKVTATLAKQ